MAAPAPLGPLVQTLELEPSAQEATEAPQQLFRWEQGTADPNQALPSPFLEKLRAARTVGEAVQALFDGRTPSLFVAQRTVAQLIAHIDGLITDQLNAVLHHPQFQSLEASWRGLEHLVSKVNEGDSDGPRVLVKVLTVKWEEIARDFDRNNYDYDQSLLFTKVYDEAFGMPGGHPFGVLVGDFEIRPNTAEPSDLEVLRSISQVAAASFCPYLSAAAPEMMGLDRFSNLEATVEFDQLYSQPQFLKWNKLRESPDSRFVTLTVPHVLMRMPYTSGYRIDGFDFREDTSAADRSGYVWGNAAYALAGVVIRAFQQSSWVTDTSGIQRGVDGGGLVTGLPVPSVETDKERVVTKFSTDLLIDDRFERDLTDHGFLPLCPLIGTEWAGFLSSTTIQKPAVYDRPEATMSAKLTSYLRYVLCVSRFAHYLKVLARDRIGQMSEARELQEYLNEWLAQYRTDMENLDAMDRAKYPLKDGHVTVAPRPGNPGVYDCIVYLQPHAEVESVSAGLTLETKLAGAGSRR